MKFLKTMRVIFAINCSVALILALSCKMRKEPSSADVKGEGHSSSPSTIPSSIPSAGSHGSQDVVAIIDEAVKFDSEKLYFLNQMLAAKYEKMPESQEVYSIPSEMQGKYRNTQLYERFEMLAFHLYTTGLLPPRIEYLECLREYVNSLDLSLEQHSQIRAVIEKSKKINIPEAKRDLAFTTAFQLFVYFEHQYANKKLVTYPGFVTSTLQSNIEIISSIKTTNMNLYKNAQSQILTTLRNQLTDKGGRPINPALLAGMQVSIKLLKPAMTSKYADSKLDAIFNHLNNAYKKSMVLDQANDLGKKKIVIEP